MRHGVYDALDAVRQTETHTVPMSVPLHSCGMCLKPIEDREDAEVYQQIKDGPSIMVHRACKVDHLTRIVRAMGRYGVGRIGAALRLDR